MPVLEIKSLGQLLDDSLTMEAQVAATAKLDFLASSAEQAAGFLPKHSDLATCDGHLMIGLL